MNELTALYTSFTGQSPKTVEAITGSGSNRQYVRFTSAQGQSVIGVVGTSLEENHAFIYLARHFSEQGLPVPHVLAASADERRYLQEDLGSRSLFDALRAAREAGGRYEQTERELLSRTIAELPRLQILGAQGLDFSQCYPQAEMDEMNVLFDLNYFKYCFLKATGVDFHEVRLEHDFHALAHDLLASSSSATFLYRDFQARNVMLDAAGRPHFIDFQGGRRGPIYYDLASFLWQASARYPAELREELIGVYRESLDATLAANGLPALHFSSSTLHSFVLFRLLQVLGAYGFRGYFERKQHFLDSIPPALQNLKELLAQEGSCPYPELRKTLKNIMCQMGSMYNLSSSEPSKVTAPSLSRRVKGGSLSLRIFSFSYKRGIPEDTSGNGGGYVFDCRSTHNPGRYEPYKQLTGLDAPVIKFLEDDGEILTFLDSVYRLADAHVERYLQRGFTDLMFSFGCTGGQHRSVYCAQHLAEHLNQKYGVQVELTHREQGIHQLLPAAIR
ncbi:MAG: phosphotransferase [Bacteroidaceae bacterium]|nr:phosphotransferase [Bacteroidaceae bacterium]